MSPDDLSVSDGRAPGVAGARVESDLRRRRGRSRWISRSARLGWWPAIATPPSAAPMPAATTTRVTLPPATTRVTSPPSAYRRCLQDLGLPDLAVRARERADRARVRRRTAYASLCRRSTSASSHGTSRRARPPWTSCALRASTWRRTSAYGGSSSPSYRRRSQTRSAGSSCAPPSTSACPVVRRRPRAPGEFWEEDFPELRHW